MSLGFLHFQGDSGSPLLQCSPTCDESFKVPNCSSAVVLGVASFSQSGPCTERNVHLPLYSPQNRRAKDIQIGAYFTDVRIHVDWIQTIVSIYDIVDDAGHAKFYTII